MMLINHSATNSNEACRLCGSTNTRRSFAKAGAAYYTCRQCRLRFAVADTNLNSTSIFRSTNTRSRICSISKSALV